MRRKKLPSCSFLNCLLVRGGKVQPVKKFLPGERISDMREQYMAVFYFSIVFLRDIVLDLNTVVY